MYLVRFKGYLIFPLSFESLFLVLVLFFSHVVLFIEADFFTNLKKSL